MLITVAGISITEFKLPDKQRYEETTKKSVVTCTKIAKTEVLLKYFKLIWFRDTKMNFILPPSQVKSSQVYCVYIFSFCGKNSNCTAKCVHQTGNPTPKY